MTLDTSEITTGRLSPVAQPEMRVLLLTMYFAPDPAANSVIMTALADQLVQMGHQVTVVAAFPHYDTNRIWDEYRGRLLEKAWRGRIRVYRTYLYVSEDKSHMLGRLLNYISFNLLSTLIGIFLRGIDVILVPSPPLTIGITAYILSRWHRIEYIYNVQDIFPDVAIRLGILKNAGLIRFFRFMEDFVYRKAAYITVLSEGFRKNLLAKGVPAGKLRTIPNFVETEFVLPLPKDNEFSRRHGLRDKFVVMYAGNVGLSQGLETVLRTAERLKGLNELVFLIVGNGADKSTLQELAIQMGLDNVTFLPFQPRDTLPQMYAAADASLVLLRAEIGSESVPSKTYSIMASGRPILASVAEHAGTRLLIERTNSGLWVKAGDVPGLVDAIQYLYHHQDDGRKMGENGRAYVETHHTPKIVALKYAELLAEITGLSGNPR